MEVAAARDDWTLAAIRWSAASVAWSLVVGGGSVAAGAAADSTALIGFGLNSLMDAIASTVLVWRFHHERVGGRVSHEVERRAGQLVGTVLALIAVYVTARGVMSLAEGSGPEPSSLGVVLTTASLFVLPILARAKLRLAGPLESQALRADGVLSGAGAALAAATLMGLGLSTALDWWWADSLTAIMIAAVLFREGALTARNA